MGQSAGQDADGFQLVRLGKLLLDLALLRDVPGVGDKRLGPAMGVPDQGRVHLANEAGSVSFDHGVFDISDVSLAQGFFNVFHCPFMLFRGDKI